MSTLRQFFSILRSPNRGFAPRAPAACEARQPRRQAASPQFAGRHAAPARLAAPDHAHLLVAGEQMLAKSRALGQAPAMAVLQIDDLPELELVFGAAAVEAVIEAALAGLARAGGGLGLVARTAPDTFALLMPGGGEATTVAAIRTSFGAPCTIEIGFGRDDLMVVPDVMVHPFAPHECVEQVHADLCRYIAKARRQRGRPAEAPAPASCDGATAAPAPCRHATAAPVRHAKAPEYCPPQPPTIPMPLRLH